MPSLGCHAEHCGHLGQTACAMRWGMWSWNERVELFLFSIILYFSVSSAVVQNIWQGSGALGYLSGCKRLQMEGCCTENYTVCLCLGLCSNCNAFIVVRQLKKNGLFLTPTLVAHSGLFSKSGSGPGEYLCLLWILSFETGSCYISQTVCEFCM